LRQETELKIKNKSFYITITLIYYFYLRGCILFRVSLFLPPLDGSLVFGLERDLALGLSARLVAPMRRNKQKREIDETII
jgi:hypothetical protein